ncbi:hypothetical protein KDA82_35030, partial [Streptomyces daliensis]|nr:hypothetical protein [Streptomyces daliensis]
YGEVRAYDDSVETLVTRAAAHGQGADEPLTLASTGVHGTGTGTGGKRRTGWRGLLATGTRRNVVAAGTGALLAAVL